MNLFSHVVVHIARLADSGAEKMGRAHLKGAVERSLTKDRVVIVDGEAGGDVMVCGGYSVRAKQHKNSPTIV